MLQCAYLFWHLLTLNLINAQVFLKATVISNWSRTCIRTKTTTCSAGKALHGMELVSIDYLFYALTSLWQTAYDIFCILVSFFVSNHEVLFILSSVCNILHVNPLWISRKKQNTNQSLSIEVNCTVLVFPENIFFYKPSVPVKSISMISQ